MGEHLRLVLSTEAGLWRYDLEDLVEVVGRCGRTPMLRFVGKAGRYLNALGERVTEAQVAAAVGALARATGRGGHIVGFTARTVPGEVPHHVLAVELDASPAHPPAEQLAETYDRALASLNVEYAGKRSSGRLAPAEVEVLPPGTYRVWRQTRLDAGAPDGQLKDPVMALDAAEWQRVSGAAATVRRLGERSS